MAYPTLSSGEYIWDAATGQLVFSNADSGQNVTATMTFSPSYVVGTELLIVPSSAPYTYIPSHGGEQQITKANGDTSNSVIFQGDIGAAYYPDGTPLTRVSGTPSAGQYAVCSYIDPSTGDTVGNDISVTPPGGGSAVGGYGQYTFAAADAGKEIVITYEYLNPDYDTWASLFGASLNISAGTQGQQPSSYMETNHPDQSVGYSLTALVEGDAAYLGTSGVMPNYSYEVQGIGVVGGGNLDADPIECAEAILTDAIIGVGIPSSYIDQASWYSNANSADNWISANQLLISQAVENQTGAGSLIGRWLGAFNIAAVSSEGFLKLIPYGDEAVGAYTPNNTVVASLDDDCYLGDKSDPVKLTRTPWADAHNRVQVSYKSRINDYNDDLVYEQDEASVERFGLRIAAPQSLEFVTTWQVATAVATMALKRLTTVRNQYEFRLPSTYEFLEPMDLIALEDSRLGLSGKIVRITKIENDPTSGLDVTCEEWPGNGYAMPVTNPKAVTPSQHPTQANAPAGNTEVVIVQADNSGTGQQGTRLYLWLSGADSSDWAGCSVYYSLDGTNYQQLDVATSPAPIYRLTSALPSVTADPSGSLGLTHDTSSTLVVQPAVTGNPVVSTAGLSAWDPDTDYGWGAMVSYDGQPWVALVANSGELPTAASAYWQQIKSATANSTAPQPVTDTAAAGLFTLAALIALTDNEPSAVEFLSYADVAAGAVAGTYNLTDLYRGALGTSIGSFPAGSQMAMFSQASTYWDVPAGMAGQTVTFKCLAWNSAGVCSQDLASAPGVEFVIAASGSVGVLEGLAGPIADVIKNNAGQGELVVNPPGGTSGTLPHTNSSTQTQAVITTGSEITNGTYLDNDSSNTIGAAHSRVITAINASNNLVTGTENRTVAEIEGVIASGGGIASAAIIAGRSEGIGTTVTHLDSTGIVLAAGIDFSRGYGNQSLKYIPDDSGSQRYAVLAVDANRRAIIDGSSAHVNWTQDYLPDTTDHVRGIGMTSSANMIANPGFEASANLPPAGWQNGGLSEGTASLSWDTATQYAGTRSLVVNATAFTNGTTQPAFSVVPGQQFKLQCALKYVSGTQPPQLALWTDDGLGAFKGDAVACQITNADNAWHVVTATGVIPAGAYRAQLVAAPQYAPGASDGIFELDACYCVRMTAMGDETYDSENRYAAIEPNADKTRNHISMAQAVGATNSPSVGFAWAQVPEMSLSVAMAVSGTVLVAFAGTISPSSGAICYTIVYVDGSPVSSTQCDMYSASFDTASNVAVLSLSAGTHTVAIYAMANASLSWYTTQRTMTITPLS